MRLLGIVFWLLVSFLAGAALYLAVAPKPVLDAVIQDMAGTSEFDRCVHAARCLKAMQTPAQPNHYRIAPADMDRA